MGQFAGHVSEHPKLKLLVLLQTQGILAIPRNNQRVAEYRVITVRAQVKVDPETAQNAVDYSQLLKHSDAVDIHWDGTYSFDLSLP